MKYKVLTKNCKFKKMDSLLLIKILLASVIGASAVYLPQERDNRAMARAEDDDGFDGECEIIKNINQIY